MTWHSPFGTRVDTPAARGSAGRADALRSCSLKQRRTIYRARASLLVAATVVIAGFAVSTWSAQAAESSGANDVTQYGTPYSEVPDAEDATIYQVNFHAFSAKGDFAGVQARLDEIKSLGVNVLYLLPVYPVGILKTVNSPYCIRDYKGVNSEFGTLDELRALVEAAHQHKMAVLFDWVGNHTSWDNPWIAHPSWYKRDKSGAIISPPNTGWKDVAALSYESKEMRAAMIDAMRYWIFQTNIDGYRCDAADFIPVEFWQQAIADLRTIKTHKLLFLAEGKRPSNYGAGFDMQYGFAFYNNMLNRIFGTHQSVESIDTLNTTEYRDATTHNRVVRYISNHDIDQSDGPPVATMGGRNGSVAAFVVAAYMKSGVMIYDGQEVGCPLKLSFFDKSTPIDWSINPDLTDEYKRILHLRDDSVAIRRGDLHSFTTDDVCAFSKTSGTEEVFVIDNLRKVPVSYEVPDEFVGDNWNDAFTGKATSIAKTASLAPYEYRVYKRK